MEIIQLNCTSCGAPIKVLPDVEIIICPYCHTNMIVERSQSQVILKMGQQVSKSIERGTDTTQVELKRLQLGQDISMLQLQLSTLQAEIRTLERQGSTPLIKKQLGELKVQEKGLIGRIKTLQASLLPAAGIPDQASYRDLAQAVPKSTPATWPDEYREPVVAPIATAKPKDWILTYVLCTFLGVFGAHRFYTGHTLVGFIQLFTLGGFAIWWLLDLLTIAFGTYRDSKKNLLSDQKSKTARRIAIGFALLLVIYLIIAIIASTNGN